ncbi:unnamed protein product [Malus baccata var. baccata]
MEVYLLPKTLRVQPTSPDHPTDSNGDDHRRDVLVFSSALLRLHKDESEAESAIERSSLPAIWPFTSIRGGDTGESSEKRGWMRRRWWARVCFLCFVNSFPRRE